MALWVPSRETPMAENPPLEVGPQPVDCYCLTCNADKGEPCRGDEGTHLLRVLACSFLRKLLDLQYY